MTSKLHRARASLVGIGTAAILLLTALPVGANLRTSGGVPGTSSLSALACPEASRCVGVGDDANGYGKSAVVDTANSVGTAWAGVLTGTALFGIACAVPTDCIAASVDQFARVDVANGAMALAGRVPPPSEGIVSADALTCPDSAECFAVGFIGAYEHTKALVVRLSVTGAVLGSVQESSRSGFGSIACPTSTSCLLAAADLTNTETIQLLTNGHLGAQRALPSSVYVQQLACYKDVACYAILGTRSKSTERTNLLYALDPATGAVTAKRSLGGSFSADGIACGSASQCWVTGSNGSTPDAIAVTNGVPGAPRHLAGTSVSGVACTDANACFAVGQNAAGGFVQRV